MFRKSALALLVLPALWMVALAVLVAHEARDHEATRLAPPTPVEASRL